MAALAPPTTSSKPPLPPRLALPLALALLALAFVADFLSYSSAISPAVSPSSKTVKDGSTKLRNGSQPVRHLNATFSDLPAPHWEWEEMPPAPVPWLDGASVQIGDLFYVVAGYESLDHVHSHMDVYNFTSNTWTGRFDMPKKMSNSHLGMASDGRYIYAVSGQFGPQCRPAVSRNFVLDTKLRKWDEMPPLPVPRLLGVWRVELSGF
uniref:Uncharacterized protein n=1 Tax=Hordeum vulgare subsp. vulgare TaxID=112509 RepID=A0A8I6YEC0_HORVV